MTRILVFQHHPSEHPGVFREFLAADGIAWDAVELDAGEPIPALDGYHALWVFGGPMDTWQEDRHPWLASEKRAIREAVETRNLPYLGVCLGHQLLAAALGGKVGPSETPEVGVCGLEVVRDDPLIGNAGGRLQALQWHSAEITAPCPGMEILASSPRCQAQAIKVGARAYGIQYHMGGDRRDRADLGRDPRVQGGPGADHRYRRPARLRGRGDGESGGLPRRRQTSLRRLHGAARLASC